jgi:hypothetical protein
MIETFNTIGRELFGGGWSTVWPLLAVPAAAAIAVRLTAEAINLQEPLWRGRAAALAVALPGLVFLSLALHRAVTFQSFDIQSWQCAVGLYGPVVTIGAILLRASVVFCRRAVEIQSLCQLATPPSARLSRLAVGSEVQVAELDVDRPICVLVGVWRPRILVSRGALDLLSDPEVAAALMHERAHARHRDTRWAALVSFVGDCALLPTTRIYALFQEARELIADREAIRRVPPVDLASAVLKFSRYPMGARLGASVAQPMDLAKRLTHLLEPGAPARSNRLAAAALCAAFAGIGSLASFPVVARHLAAILCSGC